MVQKKKLIRKPPNKRHRWHLQGGGCMVGTKHRYPCDDDYEDQITRQIINVRSTMDAHFKMPLSVARIADLRKIPGVKV